VEDKSMKSEASSAIIVRDIDRKVFLARRSLRKQYSPGEWEMVGGVMEDGETAEDCVAREIREELKCELASLKFFRSYKFAEKEFHVFEVKLDSEPRPNVQDFEEWGWFDENSIKEMNFALNCKERLLDYFEETH